MPNEVKIPEDIKTSPSSIETTLKETIKRTTKDIKPQKRITFKDNTYQMLCETTLDSTPINLNELFKHFQLEEMTTADICYQLVYLVALETGFAEKNAYEQCNKELRISYMVTSYFNAQNVHCLAQIKPTFKRDKSGQTYSMHLRSIANERQLEDAGIDESAISLIMSGIVTGDFMIISLTHLQKEKEPTNLCNIRTICLSMPRYIVGTFSKGNNKKCLNDCLRNMDEFAYKLRNEIFVPVRSYHMNLLAFDMHPSLLGLPLEAYEVIFKYLNAKDLQNLSKVNTQLHEFLTEADKDVASFRSASSRPSDLDSRNSSYFEVEPYYRQTA